MIRTQISLTFEQMARLKKAAQRRGVSMAALIREAVDKEIAQDPLDRERLWDRALDAVGRGSDKDGMTDVSRHHDAYFAQAIGEEADRE